MKVVVFAGSAAVNDNSRARSRRFAALNSMETIRAVVRRPPLRSTLFEHARVWFTHAATLPYVVRPSRRQRRWWCCMTKRQLRAHAKTHSLYPAYPEEYAPQNVGGTTMQIDRRAFLATLGSTAVIEAMPSEAKAEALEHYLIAQLDGPVPPAAAPAPAVRRGAGILFGGPSPSGRYPELKALAPMPEWPTLVDFLRLRGSPGIGNHILQSANDALKKGEPEEVVLACLLHDYVLNLIKVDHGWWSAQLVEPYVSEKVSWAIRYHQALRFYPDASVGYEYPELYVRLFGKEYVPDPYVRAAYEHARNHKWYMVSRMITVHDLYAFEPGMKVSIDPFVDIIGRHFKQPKEGLGFDGSPVAHFWRTLIYPDNPL